MTGYNPHHPSKPMGHTEAMEYLQSEYAVSAVFARNLLAAARESTSGMAKHRRSGQRAIWATHMSHLGGKFVIELD